MRYYRQAFHRQLLLAFLFTSPLILVACQGNSSDPHEGHSDHDEHGEVEGSHADVVHLNAIQLAEAEVVIESLSGGDMKIHVELPAEIGLNQDAIVHVTPRVSGIVSAVYAFNGQEVHGGDLLAVLNSPELGETKISYLQAVQAKQIADTQLARQATISENTDRLLNILSAEPSLEDLYSKAKGLRIGANKGRLLSAYAQVRARGDMYTSEKELSSKGLSTQSDLLESRENFRTAQAKYMADYEDVDFSFRLALQEARKDAMIALSSVENAKRRLLLLGLSRVNIEEIANEPDENVARYELSAPMDGRVIAKHITPGEKVGVDASVYTVADLSSLWINISAYESYSNMIKEGQPVTMRVGDRYASGVVSYISAVVSEATRTVTARVVLDNTDGAWKSGEFVTVRVQTEMIHVERIVPIVAIQTYEGRTVVFVQDGDEIGPVAVHLGKQSETHVELLGDDVALGAQVVVSNSFLIKAELGKAAAGHQH